MPEWQSHGANTCCRGPHRPPSSQARQEMDGPASGERIPPLWEAFLLAPGRCGKERVYVPAKPWSSRGLVRMLTVGASMLSLVALEPLVRIINHPSFGRCFYRGNVPLARDGKGPRKWQPAGIQKPRAHQKAARAETVELTGHLDWPDAGHPPALR